MLGIKIGTEFLDLPPGLTIEQEEPNPFLQFSDQVTGGYSFPFEVKATPKNLRLLQYAGLLQKRIDNTGIDAQIFENGIQTNIGKIKIEKPTNNLNRVQDGSISCYLLTGYASFYQDVKNKNLRDIDTGGDRTFAWAGLTTSGFWGHVNDVLRADPGTYDYAIYPVINHGWMVDGTDSILVMNNTALFTGQPGIVDVNFQTKSGINHIVPFPYLKYIMIKAAAAAGYMIEGDIFDDDDFKKITMINFHAIDWCTYKRASVGHYTYTPHTNITFNVSDCLPNMGIGEFFIALKNRFAWWYDFDTKGKRITIQKLSDSAISTANDFTQHSSPVIPRPILQDSKIYALRNQFATDLGDGAPDLKTVDYQGQLDAYTDLPTAADTILGRTYLVVEDNSFYICLQNDDTGDFEWQLYAYNIYDYAPDNSTEDITTAATTVGMEHNDDYQDLIPRIDAQGQWFGREDNDTSWGIHLCFFHGVRDNRNGDPLSYGSPHIYDSAGVQVSEWGLPFECFKTDGTDVGLYTRNWKELLDLLNSDETLELTLYLPYHEYLKLKFSNRIIIAGVLMFVSTKKSRKPYDGSIVLECIRIFT
jgi:hypothetical protein